MCKFDIVLVDDGIMERGVDAYMAEQTLNLFDGHSLVDGHGCQRATEFVRMHFRDVELLPQFSYTEFDSTDGQPIVW